MGEPSSPGERDVGVDLVQLSIHGGGLTQKRVQLSCRRCNWVGGLR
jgi:hypothetical protein